MNKIPVNRPSVSGEELGVIKDVINSKWLTRGKWVEEFEIKVAEYVGSSYALAVNSATSGLFLCLKALGIREGDEVIIPAFTFPATANVVEHLGAKPIFVDIELERMGLDPKGVERVISSKTKAIILVHLFGMSAKIEQIISIAKKYGLYMVEDAAPALGVVYKGKYVGTFGDCGVYSFHPRKIITTGEGGIIVTYNKALFDKMKALHSHGETTLDTIRASKTLAVYPDFVEAGYNFRMTNFQGALGVVQMKKIENIINERRKIAKMYLELLEPLSQFFILPKESSYERFTYQSFVIYFKLGKASPLINFLRRHGIESMKGTYNVPKVSYYRKKYGYSSKDFKNTEFAEDHSITLPLFEHMESNVVEYIVDCIRRYLRQEVKDKNPL